ncbi:MAG: transposase zinc-binding domain-containing protein, partial [Pirellulales bacterium]|nr:transposase zinc-binding domain-containing protein [Pirellulales bacterium]
MVAAVTGFPARPRLRPHGGPAASRRYERRRPEKTPLHKIISENLESWLEWREAAERPVPGYVEDELRGYFACGILCFGFARARCTTCGQGFVVAFSCKGRGVCPSCNGRHMAQTAAHLVDHVIPPGPMRQWVISVPKRLRGFLADRPPAVAALTKIFLDEIERLLCGAAGGASDPVTPASARPRLGGISFLHRFGSALNHHVHVHACVTDGVFVPPPRKHRHRYHGVFAPNHKLRRAVTALAIGNVGKQREAVTSEHGGDGHDTEGCCDATHATQKPRSHDTSRITWAKLMARVGEE